MTLFERIEGDSQCGGSPFLTMLMSRLKNGSLSRDHDHDDDDDDHDDDDGDHHHHDHDEEPHHRPLIILRRTMLLMPKKAEKDE